MSDLKIYTEEETYQMCLELEKTNSLIFCMQSHTKIEKMGIPQNSIVFFKDEVLYVGPYRGEDRILSLTSCNPKLRSLCGAYVSLRENVLLLEKPVPQAFWDYDTIRREGDNKITLYKGDETFESPILEVICINISSGVSARRWVSDPKRAYNKD